MSLKNDFTAKIRSLKDDLDFDTINFDETGLDYYVAFINDNNGKSWTIKIPKRTDVFEQIEKENKLLKLIRSNISISVPNWEINNGIIIYPSIIGKSVATPDQMQNGLKIFNIDPSDDNFVNSLAKFLVDLHSINNEEIEKFNLGTKTIEDVRKSLYEDIKLISNEWDISEKLLKRWETWLDDDTKWPDYTKITHGDLHGAHILVNDNNTVTGVLDWSEASQNDISVDFVLHYSIFGEKNFDKLLDAYKANGGTVWKNIKNQIKERIYAFPIKIAKFTLKSNIDEYYQNTQDILDYYAFKN